MCRRMPLERFDSAADSHLLPVKSGVDGPEAVQEASTAQEAGQEGAAEPASPPDASSPPCHRPLSSQVSTQLARLWRFACAGQLPRRLWLLASPQLRIMWDWLAAKASCWPGLACCPCLKHGSSPPHPLGVGV